MRRSPVGVQQAHDSTGTLVPWPLWYLSAKPRAFRSGGPRYRVPPATSTWEGANHQVLLTFAGAQQQPAAVDEVAGVHDLLCVLDALVVHVRPALAHEPNRGALGRRELRSSKQVDQPDREVAIAEHRGRQRALERLE